MVHSKSWGAVKKHNCSNLIHPLLLGLVLAILAVVVFGSVNLFLKEEHLHLILQNLLSINDLIVGLLAKCCKNVLNLFKKPPQKPEIDVIPYDQFIVSVPIVAYSQIDRYLVEYIFPQLTLEQNLMIDKGFFSRRVCEPISVVPEKDGYISGLYIDVEITILRPDKVEFKVEKYRSW